jgi:hypothetical protein
MIQSWSHSRVILFEQCKFRAYLQHDQKVPEPQRPLPPGKTEHANDRGTRIHQSCEDYVSGKSKVLAPEAAKYFGAELEAMRNLHSHGCVSLEGEWGMNQNWEPWDWRGQWVDIQEVTAAIVKETEMVKAWPDRPRAGAVYSVGGKKFRTWVPAWLRLKLDAIVFESETSAIAIDYKSGKKYGNEMKHGEQLQLYQLVTFLRYPKLEKVTTELWYLDQDEITQREFRRDQGLRFMKSWDKRGTALTTCQVFPPNPNPISCRYCMYGPFEGGSGHCRVGRK